MPCFILLGLVMCAVNPNLKRRILTVGISVAGYTALFVIAAKRPELIRTISEQAMVRDQIIAVVVSAFTISLLLFLFLWRYGKKERFGGETVCFYVFFYAVGRFLVEFLRGDTARGFIGALSTSQFIAIPLFLTGVLWYRLRYTGTKKA
mgnify:CR=1 FL=1